MRKETFWSISWLQVCSLVLSLLGRSVQSLNKILDVLALVCKGWWSRMSANNKNSQLLLSSISTAWTYSRRTVHMSMMSQSRRRRQQQQQPLFKTFVCKCAHTRRHATCCSAHSDQKLLFTSTVCTVKCRVLLHRAAGGHAGFIGMRKLGWPGGGKAIWGWYIWIHLYAKHWSANQSRCVGWSRFPDWAPTPVGLRFSHLSIQLIRIIQDKVEYLWLLERRQILLSRAQLAGFFNYFPPAEGNLQRPYDGRRVLVSRWDADINRVHLG